MKTLTMIVYAIEPHGLNFEMRRNFPNSLIIDVDTLRDCLPLHGSESCERDCSKMLVELVGVAQLINSDYQFMVGYISEVEIEKIMGAIQRLKINVVCVPYKKYKISASKARKIDRLHIHLNSNFDHFSVAKYSQELRRLERRPLAERNEEVIRLARKYRSKCVDGSIPNVVDAIFDYLAKEGGDV